jgi:hypothetical protein
VLLTGVEAVLEEDPVHLLILVEASHGPALKSLDQHGYVLHVYVADVVL